MGSRRGDGFQGFVRENTVVVRQEVSTVGAVSMLKRSARLSVAYGDPIMERRRMRTSYQSCSSALWGWQRPTSFCLIISSGTGARTICLCVVPDSRRSNRRKSPHANTLVNRRAAFVHTHDAGSILLSEPRNLDKTNRPR